MRIIDADEALRMMKNSKSDCPCTDTIWKGTWVVAYDCAISCVEACLTVDAKPVVHGEWSIIEDDYTGMVALECSECNQEYWFEDEPKMKIYSYCPNCGARMDLEGIK